MTEGYVVDTNVLISAMLSPNWASTPSRVVNHIQDSAYLIMSRETAFELDKIAARSKFDRYAEYTIRRKFVLDLKRTARFVHPEDNVVVCRDPADDMILATAIAGDAKAIVSGDQDLLSLKSFRHIPILTPADFLKGITPPSQPGS